MDALSRINRANSKRSSDVKLRSDGLAVAGKILGVGGVSVLAGRTSALHHVTPAPDGRSQRDGDNPMLVGASSLDGDRLLQHVLMLSQELKGVEAGSQPDSAHAAIAKSHARRDALRKIGHALQTAASCRGGSNGLCDITASDLPDGAMTLLDGVGDGPGGSAAALLQHAWPELVKPLVRCIGDQQESVRLGVCRALRILLSCGAVTHEASPRALSLLLPALCAPLRGSWVVDVRQHQVFVSAEAMDAVHRGRVTGWASNRAAGGHGQGAAPAPEPSDAVRTCALDCLAALFSAVHRLGCPGLLGPYGEDVAMALHGGSRDPDPNVRSAACQLLCDLAGTQPNSGGADNGGGGGDSDDDDGAVDPATAPFRGRARDAVALLERACASSALPPPPPRRTSLILPSLLVPFAPALARSLGGAEGGGDGVGGDGSGCTNPAVASCGPGLWHRTARVRLGSLLALDALVRCPNDARGGAGSGSAAIPSLLGQRDQGVVPVAAFYATHGTGRNSLARLLTDGSHQVRLALACVLGRWMVCLVDRADWWPRLTPYLLSLLGDAHPPVASAARCVLDACGAVHEAGLRGPEARRLLDKLQAGEDGDAALAAAGVYDMPPPAPLAIGTGLASRPAIGTRLFVRANARTFLPPLMSQVATFAPFGQGHGAAGLQVGIGAGERTAHDTRHRAAVLLAVVVLHFEETIAHDVPAMLPALVDALAASDTAGGSAAANGLRADRACAPDFTYDAWIAATVSLLGRFVTADVWRPALGRSAASRCTTPSELDERGGVRNGFQAEAASLAAGPNVALGRALGRDSGNGIMHACPGVIIAAMARAESLLQRGAAEVE